MWLNNMVDLKQDSLKKKQKKKRGIAWNLAWQNLRLQQSSIAQEWKLGWVNKNMRKNIPNQPQL